MKSSQFKSVDYICMRKLKAPIEKFNNLRDFQRWALEKIKTKNYKFPARTEKYDKLRNDLVAKWLQIFCWQPKYPFAFALVFINEICKKLKPTNDDTPEIYNPIALENTYQEIKNKGENTQFRFLDVYKKHLLNIFNNDEIPENGWLVIESLTNDWQNYQKNITKLQMLSHRSWCTKAPYARTLLMYANFHILMENGKSKVVIRVMEDDIIDEIQSIGNQGPKPQDIPAIEKYIQQQKLKLNPDVQQIIKKAKNSIQ